MKSGARNNEFVGLVTAVLVALAFAIPASGIVAWERGGAPVDVYIYGSGSALERVVSSAGIPVVERYDTFVLAKASGAQLRALERNGFEYGFVTDLDVIGMRSYTFRTSGPEPSLPENLRSVRLSASDEMLYLVQLKGPVKETWLTTLEGCGAEVFGYMPNNAYIVRMDALEEEQVRSMQFVRWVGYFHPGYKLLPELGSGEYVVTVWNGPQAGYTFKSLPYLSDLVSSSYDSTRDTYTFRVQAKPENLAGIAALPDVLWIDWYDEPQLCDETGVEIIGGYWTAHTPWDGNGCYVNTLGWDGSGVVVSVADTGIGDGTVGDAGHLDFENRVTGGSYYGTLTDWVDGHAHGTHVSGIVAADGAGGTGFHYPNPPTGTQYYAGWGVAPDAQLYAQRIFGAGGGFEEPASWDGFFNDCYNANGYVHQNSWGGYNDGGYHDYCVEYDQAARDQSTTTSGDQPLVICIAAGNAYSANTIGSPAGAKNAITVAAYETYHPDAQAHGDTDTRVPDNPEDIADFSSRGFMDDNRIKPDVGAPGVGILSTHSPSAPATNLYGLFTNPTENRYEWCSGTSQACPHGSGSAADIVEWYTATQGGVRPMPAMVKALMINTAHDVYTANIPNADEGWGTLFLPDIVSPATHQVLKDNPQTLQTGQTYSLVFPGFESASEPVKISLVWTDPAAAELANPTLVNNLDLRVTMGGSTIYYGNAFTDGFSAAGAPAGNTNIPVDWDVSGDNFDDRNNVECVFIAPGDLTAGIFNVEVIGQNIVTDAVSGGGIDQDFALVVTNLVEDPNLPDLTIYPGDLTASTTTPNEGQIVNLNAIVHNVGINDPANGVEVGFYDGNPAMGGTLIAKVTTTPPNIPANGGSATAGTTWDTAGLAGYHTIYARADPDNDIPELTKGNNTRTLNITVQGYAVDLSCATPSKSAQPGNNVVYNITVKNAGTLPDSFTLWFTQAPPPWTASLSTTKVAGLASLASQVITLTVQIPPTAMPSEYKLIDVYGRSENNTAKTDFVRTNSSAMPGILLVNDGNAAIATYQTALDNNGYQYDMGTPATPLSLYKVVIWATYSASTLAAAEKTALMNYMNAGGRVYMNGEDIGYDIAADDDTAIGLGPSPNNFYGLYCHATYLADSSGGTLMNGVAGDPITNGMANYDISGSYPEAINALGASASVIFRYNDATTRGAAVKADTGIYRMVYIGCEYFEGSTDAQANKDLLMYRIIEWLYPDLPPAVTLNAPDTPESILSGTINIAWTATDDYPLAAGCIDLFYSANAGTTWSSIIQNIDNTGTYAWDTVAGAIPDGVSYRVRVNATDSAGKNGWDASGECFSIDNVANDRWFLQIETANLAGNRDLDMKPSELTPQTLATSIPAPGEIVLASFASQYTASGIVDIGGGPWTFNTYARTTASSGNGNLYARVYGDTGSGRRLIFTTAYDDELVGSFQVNHLFTWTHSPSAGTNLLNGEHVVVELVLHATAGSGTSYPQNLATRDIPVSGTVTGTYLNTQTQDDGYEVVTELAGPATYTIYSNDFESGSLSGWTLGGASNDWQIGTPSGINGDPPSAYGGTYSIGNDLTGLGTYPRQYENSIATDSNYIYTPVINCAGYTGVRIQFMRWLGIESATYDHAYIEASRAPGGPWTQIWSHTSATTIDTSWTSMSYSIATVADNQAAVYVRFEMGATDGSVVYCGWNIDNLAVVGNRTTSYLEHKWSITVPAGRSPYTFRIDAYRTTSADNDNFVFAYSTDNVTFTDMVTVTATTDTDAYLTYTLPTTLSGAVYIRVRDTDRTAGRTVLDIIRVDHMYIESTEGPPQLVLAYDHNTTPSNVVPRLQIASIAYYEIAVVAGWNLVSLPLTPGSPALPAALVDRDGDTLWNRAMWWNPQTPNDRWKQYYTGWPGAMNDLTSMDVSRGVWLFVTTVGDGYINVSGTLPTSTGVQLYAGWNLIGYPARVDTTYTVGQLKAATGATTVEGFSAPATYKTVVLADGFVMKRGQAYWVYVPADIVWTVNW